MHKFYSSLNYSPRVDIADDVWPWLCFGFDITTIILLILSYLAAYATASCGNKYYDANWKSVRHVSIYSEIL